jgi:acyl-coenzyme A thioesterase PaaI-like protein
LFEGPSGSVHGGFLATTFDIVGSALVRPVLEGAVTRSLTVRYLRPTPLGPVRVEGRLERFDTMLADVSVLARVDGRITSRARLQFARPGRRPVPGQA